MSTSYDDLSRNASLKNWPSDNSKERGRHAAYAALLLSQLMSHRAELLSALAAQGKFQHTSQYASNVPLIRVLSAFALIDKQLVMARARIAKGKNVEIIGGAGRRLLDQAFAGLATHMESYQNAIARAGIHEDKQVPIPKSVKNLEIDASAVYLFLE